MKLTVRAAIYVCFSKNYVLNAVVSLREFVLLTKCLLSTVLIINIKIFTADRNV